MPRSSLPRWLRYKGHRDGAHEETIQGAPERVSSSPEGSRVRCYRRLPGSSDRAEFCRARRGALPYLAYQIGYAMDASSDAGAENSSGTVFHGEQAGCCRRAAFEAGLSDPSVPILQLKACVPKCRGKVIHRQRARNPQTRHPRTWYHPRIRRQQPGARGNSMNPGNALARPRQRDEESRVDYLRRVLVNGTRVERDPASAR
jgi:hypothetical protein